MNDEPKQYGVVHHTDPDLLLALATITKAIKDLKKEPPREPQFYEMEACAFPGEKAPPWWQGILLLLLLVIIVVCINYGLASLS